MSTLRLAEEAEEAEEIEQVEEIEEAEMRRCMSEPGRFSGACARMQYLQGLTQG